MSLSSLGSFSALASTAFDTARSTIRAMADAATQNPTGDTSAKPTTDSPATEKLAGENPASTKPEAERPTAAERIRRAEQAAAEAARAAAHAAGESKPAKGIRIGSVLDAYA